MGKDSTKRSVLVFFINHKAQEEFMSKTNIRTRYDYYQVLHEGEAKLQKESMIKNASSQGYVTLLTKEFGRGTDFISRDEVVNSNGGVHVI